MFLKQWFMYRHIRFYAVEVFCCRNFKLCPNCSVERTIGWLSCDIIISINDVIKGSEAMTGYRNVFCAVREAGRRANKTY